MKRAFAVLLVLISPLLAFAQYNCSIQQYPGLQGVTSINIMTGIGWTSNDAANNAIGYAANQWSASCGGAGYSFPVFDCGPGDGYPVAVNYHSEPGPRCGVATTNYFSNGIPYETTIDVFASSPDSGYPTCEPISDAIAHELGHVLGLEDVSYASSCYGSIMGSRYPLETRTVTESDCQAADIGWYTPEEQERDNRITECAVACAGWCDPNGICMQCDENGCYPMQSPVIINLSTGPFELTSIAGGVTFDLGAVGTPYPTSWTAAGRGLAFVCLDRNHNGTIDSGRELFGDRTPLRSGKLAPNGFDALAEFDTAARGGNDNGYVDPGDTIWKSLLLWVDRNHDGVSQRDELEALSAAGITAIALDYKLDERRDRYGNRFHYRATAIGDDALGVRTHYVVYDIVLQQKVPRP